MGYSMRSAPKATLVFFSIFMISVMSCGCLEDPVTPSISKIPKLVVDYVEQENKLYVHASSDFRYTNISIYAKDLDNGIEWSVFENETYCSRLYFNSTHYYLLITVYDLEKGYLYEGNITINQVEPVLEVDHNGKLKKVETDGLPYKASLRTIK